MNGIFPLVLAILNTFVFVKNTGKSNEKKKEERKKKASFKKSFFFLVQLLNA